MRGRLLLLALALFAIDTTWTITIPVAEAESWELTIAGEGDVVVLIGASARQQLRQKLASAS